METLNGIILLLTAQIISAQDPPTVTVQQPSYSVSIGQSVTLVCNVTSSLTITSVYWQRNIAGSITQITSTTNTNKYSGSTTNTPSLTIFSTSFSDAGSYTCFATNSVGTGQSSATTLSVTGDPPTVTVQQPSYSVSIGQSVTLVCNVTSSLTITSVYWQRNIAGSITQITSTTNTNKYSGSTTNTPSLTIFSTSFSDAGSYTCFATNSVGTGQSSATTLSVTGDPPTVTVQPLSYSVSIGQSVTLVCTVTSSLTITSVFWQRNIGGSITQITSTTNTNKYNGSTTNTPSLTIFSASSSDSGSYTCFATNSVGTGQSSATTLSVTGVNVQWSTWSTWLCSVTCGQGTKTRHRSCDNPALNNSGDNCLGDAYVNEACIRDHCPDMPVGIIIAGTVSACVVLIAVIVAVLFIRNRKKDATYEVPVIQLGEEHVYIERRTRDDYHNTDISLSVQMENKKDILFEYTVSDLIKMFHNKQMHTTKMQEEFQWLTQNKSLEYTQDYGEDVLPVYLELSSQSYVNRAFERHDITTNTSVVTETPHQNAIEEFWRLVNEHKIQDIILLVQRKEKITDFFPTTDEPIEMQNLELKLISCGRQQNGIFLYSLELNEQESKRCSEISLYKTTDWKIEDTLPDMSTLCKLITASDESSRNVLNMGSKNTGFHISGVLSVCQDVVNKIKAGKKISILQSTLDIVKSHPDLFQTFEEYELCYSILQHYLENEHCYAEIF